MFAILAEAQERYKHELLSVDERELLHDRILRLKKKLAAS